MVTKEQAVATLLLKNRDTDPSGWLWISKPGLVRLSKKRANKYLLACTLDYQMQYVTAWENARRFAEDVLGDPTALWDTITSVPLWLWNRKFRAYGLHRFPKAHERVWKIGKRVVEWYEGDARRIWEHTPTADVLDRLVELGVGEQLSRMAVGGLRDCGWLKGRADVKADSHVMRVLGRVFMGQPMTEDQTIAATRRMHPRDPWLLDGPLWQLGSNRCNVTEPNCEECYLRPRCRYARKTA